MLQNFEKSQNFLEKDGSRIEVSCDKSVKYVRFWKIHIYFERGDVAASFYTNNSISIFFRKIDFSEGGPLIIL
jgi:hypothetical protein